MSRTEPLVSFIILTRNRRESLARAILSVKTQEYSTYEIIVVDNGSSDGTPDLIRSRFPEVRVVELKENCGAAGGRNRGVAASKGEYLIFLDDDCVLPEPDAAQSVVSNFDSDPVCGAIAFRIFDPLKSDRIYRLSGTARTDVAVETVRFCTGGVAIRRRVLEETGGFYEPYFIEHEDTDLALQILNSGGRIMLRSDIAVYHPSATPGAPRNYEREIYYNVRNSLWFAMRLLPVAQWVTLLLPKLLRCFRLAWRSSHLSLFMRGLSDGLRGASERLAHRRPLRRDIVRRAKRLGIPLWV